MAKYAILIYAPAPADWQEAPGDELQAHGEFAGKVTELGGELITGYALQSATTAKSARADGVADGPLIDTADVLGGVTIIEARDTDHALEIARHNPATWRGGIEVRPLL